MTDLTGEQFGNYRLSHLIGRGGFADVYLGTHVYLHTRAAIKILQVRLTEDALEDFLSEARIIVQLEHPHIVRVLECSVEKGVPFLAMNYAPGGSLRQRYPLGTRLPLEQVAQYVSQIASALQYAHERKLIHRDIKPENMLLGENEKLLLSDFGLVLLVQSTGSQTTKEMAGTVPYMAPEQLQGKPQPASDQYALGIVAYEWLSGERPFRGSFVEVASQHVLSAPPPLYGRVPGIAREVEQVVLTALAKKPTERFASVQAFANALEQTIAPTQAPGQLSPATPPGGGPPAVALESGPTLAAPYLTPPQRPITPVGQQGGSVTPVFSQPSQLPYLNNYSVPPTSEVSQSDLPTYISEPRMRAVPGGANTPMSHSSPTAPAFLPQTTPVGAPSTGTSYESRRAEEEPRRSRTPVIALLCLILILLLVVTPFLLIPGLRQSLGIGSGPSPTITTSPRASASPTDTPTTTPTATPTDTPTPTPTTAPAGPPPFSVTGVNATANPSNYHGACTSTMTFTFTGTILVPSGTSGGTVSYTWLRSDNATGPTETVSFAPGDTTQTVTTTWQLGSVWGNGTLFWEALKVISPNSVTSSHANFSFVCASPSFSVTGINASVNPATYDCSQSQVTFNFTAIIVIPAGSPGGNITYAWARSDGASMAPITVSVAAGQTQVTVTDTWTLFTGVPNGTYWERVDVTAPNSFSSNQATFTVSC